jgi:DNA-binding response OmpR family regulator
MAFVPKILVVSDLQVTSPLWAFASTQQNLKIILESDPANAIQRWAETLPEMVVLDVDSESAALELIMKLRDQTVIPILLLTSVRSQKFMLEAYQAGVDEFILRPIHPSLFDAKIKAWLRRFHNLPANQLDSLRVGNFHLVPPSRSLQIDDYDPIHLTHLELRLLYYLMAWPGRTVATEELCRHVWGAGGEGDSSALKNLVYRLRRKIEANPAQPRVIRTIVGVGYRFIGERVSG